MAQTQKHDDQVKDFKACDVYRLLDHLYAQHKGQYAFLGDEIDPHEDLVHIHSALTYGHKASGVQKVEVTSDDKYALSINHLNLAGMYGPLPDVYGEAMQGKGQLATREFLDIFHHRLMGLLYRFYRKNRVFLGSTSVKETIIGDMLHHLTGLSLFKKQFLFEEKRLYPFFNLFWRNNPSICGLKQLIHGYFHLPVNVLALQGNWQAIPHKQWSYLNGPYNALNKSLFLGRKYWDHAYGVTVQLGPLDFETYYSFIPPVHQNFQILKQLMHYYIGREFHVRLQLGLNAQNVPVCRLGQKSFLNFTTWLIPQDQDLVAIVSTSIIR